MARKWYTQREWDRTGGWGAVPKEYAKPERAKDEQEDRSAVEDADD